MHADPLSSSTAKRLSQRYRHRGWGAALLCHLLGVGVFIWLASHPGTVLQVEHSGGRSSLLHGRLLNRHDLAAMAMISSATREPTPSTPAAQPGETLLSTPDVAARQAPPPRPHPPKKASAARTHSAAAVAIADTPPVPPQPSRAARAAATAPVASTQRATLQRPAAKRSAVPAETSAGTSQPATASISATVPSAAQATANSAVAASSRPADLDADGGPVIHTARYLGTPPHKEYPPLARRRGWQGTVLVEIWLDAQGEQQKREVIRSSGYAELDRAALRLVAASAFAPYKFNGVGHAARLHLPVAFSLNDPS